MMDRILSRICLEYLTWLGETSEQYTVLQTYTSGDGYILKYTLLPKDHRSPHNLELRIHTPAFDSSMVQHESFITFLQTTLSDDHEENRTASCSQTPKELMDRLESSQSQV